MWRSNTFDKVVGLWPATLHSMLLLHKFFSRIGTNQLNWIRNNTIWKIIQALVSTGTFVSMIIRYWFWFPLSFYLLKMKLTLQVNEKWFLQINVTLVLKAEAKLVAGLSFLCLVSQLATNKNLTKYFHPRVKFYMQRTAPKSLQNVYCFLQTVTMRHQNPEIKQQ